MVAFGRISRKHQMNRARATQVLLVVLTLTFAVAARPAEAAEPWESVPINPKVEHRLHSTGVAGARKCL